MHEFFTFQWNMVCDRRILIASSQSVLLGATPSGAIIGGLISDRYSQCGLMSDRYSQC